MKIQDALIATFAAVGQDMPDVAVAMMTKDLSGYAAVDIGTALSRCRKELRRITLADILDRIPGGHPGVEEAWSIVAKTLNDESASIVWTDEIRTAYGAANDLRDDPIAARMAFREVYSRLVAESRDQKKPLNWTASLGTDVYGRESALQLAVEKKRLSAQYVAGLLPHLDAPAPQVLALIEVKPIPHD